MRMFQRLLLFMFLSYVYSIPQLVSILESDISKTNPTTLVCPLRNAFSAAEISWEYSHSTENFTVLPTKTVSINITSVDEAGSYSCKVNNTTVANFVAAYFAQPKIQNARQSVTFNDGDANKKLTCISSGSYPQVNFVWKIRKENENTYDEIDSRNFTNINITNYAESSVILFHNLTYGMQAYYQCYADNTVGNGTTEVLIRVKDKLAALWPFLGIVGEVTLLILLIFIYEKHSKQKADASAPAITGDVDKPLNVETDNEGGDSKVRNRLSNNNHKE